MSACVGQPLVKNAPPVAKPDPFRASEWAPTAEDTLYLSQVWSTKAPPMSVLGAEVAAFLRNPQYQVDYLATLMGATAKPVAVPEMGAMNAKRPPP